MTPFGDISQAYHHHQNNNNNNGNSSKRFDVC